MTIPLLIIYLFQFYILDIKYFYLTINQCNADESNALHIFINIQQGIVLTFSLSLYDSKQIIHFE
jgi:hypothetical protein